MKIKICSYNCCSLNKNIDIVRQLTFDKLDIIFLQETFVTDEKLGLLDFIDEKYDCIGIGAQFSNKCLSEATGRPMGGLACLWRSDAFFNVQVLLTNTDFIVLKLKYNNTSIILVNIYLRSDLGDPVTLENYVSGLNQLECVLSEFECENIFYCGDFNTDPYIGGRSWRNLSNFMSRNDLQCYDMNLLNENTVTHTNYGTFQCRWLDHVIGRSVDEIRVTNVEVLSDLVGSDHLPLITHIDIPTLNNYTNVVHVDNDKLFINWDSLSESQVKEIDRTSVGIQGDFRNDFDSECEGYGCRSEKCLKQIDDMYLILIRSVEISSNKFQKKRIKKNKYKVIPGWNRRVKSLHKSAREHYLAWMNNGKDRTGIHFERMTTSRKVFKEELHKCKQNENEEISQSIQEKYKSKSMKQFWSEVRNKKGVSSQSCLIDDAKNNEEIIDIFSNKFLPANESPLESESILLNDINDKLTNSDNIINLVISLETVRKLAKNLNPGRGHDMIHSRLLKEGSDEFLSNIVTFINACYKHYYFPYMLLKGEINPIIKDNKKSKCDSTNYRPIMVSSCILRLIESHMLEFIKERIHLDNQQFGFRSNSSTTDATFILKETITANLGHNSYVYGKFVDLSKAFDLVDHYKLGKKLLESGLPVDLETRWLE